MADKNPEGQELQVQAQFFELQKHEIAFKQDELAVKNNELDLEKHKSNNEVKIAEKSIAAQLETEKLRQQAYLKSNKSKSIIVGLLLLAITSIIFYALYDKQTDIIMEIVKLIAVFAGGYGIGLARSKHKDKE